MAGPVCASSVIIPPDFPLEVLNDSKKLTEKKRLLAEKLIKEKCLWGIAFVDHETIDKINILQASLLAMRLAYEQMMLDFDAWCASCGIAPADVTISAITDGTSCPDIPCACRCEPKADGTYPAVMAASIIAKTARDRIMTEYDAQFPQYGYAKHKGYPTKAHRDICRAIGPSPIQRLSFSY